MSIEEQIDQRAASAKKKRIAILAALLILLALIIAALVYYMLRQKPITTIISGTAKPVYMRSIDGNFDWPLGAAVNADGSRVYVVDSNNRLIKAYSSAGKALLSFGKVLNEKTGGEGFVNPLYVAVAPKGDVYITDRSTGTVSIYGIDGKYKSRLVPKTDEANFAWSPLGIAIDASGNIYISDATKGQHRILVLDKNGKLKLKFGKEGNKNGEFEYPNSLTVDKNGNIYVSDSNNGRVQVFDKTGKFKMVIGKSGKNSVGHPVGIGIDGNNRLNVVDTFGHNVVVYDLTGKFLYKFGDFGNKDGQFMFPMGLACYGNTIYVVDREGKRLQVWSY